MVNCECKFTLYASMYAPYHLVHIKQVKVNTSIEILRAESSQLIQILRAESSHRFRFLELTVRVKCQMYCLLMTLMYCQCSLPMSLRHCVSYSSSLGVWIALKLFTLHNNWNWSIDSISTKALKSELSMNWDDIILQS